jgi:hypothetical protein
MYLFATTALEQFVDNLSNTPQYLQNLISLPALKKSPALFERINEKFNELTNKNKLRADEANVSTGSATLKDKHTHPTHNPMINNNLVVFDSAQEDKRDKMNVKMPDFNREKFNNAFYNFSSPNNPYGMVQNPTLSAANQYPNVKPKQIFESQNVNYQNNLPGQSFFTVAGDALGVGSMYYPGMSNIINITI